MYNTCKVFCFTGVFLKGNIMDDLLYLYLLFEYYSELLTERQRDVCDMYINQNLSLGEISLNLGISRQGVRECLVKAEKLLNGYEIKLKMYEKSQKINAALGKISDVCYRLKDKENAEIIVKLANEIEELI